MKTSRLLAGDLTPAAFSELVRGVPPTNNSVWAEFPDRWLFTAHAQSLIPELIESSSGRIFAVDGELRWRRIRALGDNCMRTVFLGEAAWPGVEELLENASAELEALTPRISSFVLWGELLDETGEWIEARVPHRFSYPVEGRPARCVLDVEQWVNTVNGRTEFVRFRGISGFGGRADA